MTAKEARKVLNDSDSYLKSLLDAIFNEVESQAKQGLNWAHVNIKHNDSTQFLDRVQSELVLLGYSVENFNSAHNFTIKW